MVGFRRGGLLMVAAVLACAGSTQVEERGAAITAVAGPLHIRSCADAPADSLAWAAADLDGPITMRRDPALSGANGSGTAVLRFVIDRNGAAERCNIEVVSATSPAFIEAATVALRHALYSVPRRDGAPVRVQVTQRLFVEIGQPIILP